MSRLGGLAGAGLLALAVSAAQVVPVAEFLWLGNVRGEQFPVLRSRFSVEPYRLAESVWPGVFGQFYPVSRTWLQAIPPRDEREWWEPSLYIGGLTLVLGLSAGGFRKVSRRQVWLTSIAAAGLMAGLGKFGGPLWWARCLPSVGSVLGPHDPTGIVNRTDTYLPDASGSVYEVFAWVFPGFGLFRYPAKLLTFTSAALAVLAGRGWDELASGRSGRFRRLGLSALAASAGGLVLALALRGPAVAYLSGRAPAQWDIGPADIGGGWTETQRALAHGLIIYAAGLALAAWGPRRPGRAGAAALVLLSIDLALANGRLIWTAPQSSFDAVPEAARQIAEAERRDPSPGPFRIHRRPLWHPSRFLKTASPARVRELTEWSRETLWPLSSLPVGLAYCVTSGAIGLDDYHTIFTPQMRPVSAEVARTLRIPPDQTIYYDPRRAYDLWGARYFILPIRPSRWSEEGRGYAALLPDTEVIYPEPGRVAAQGGVKVWAEREDWQVLRNKAAYPRAWLVHQARFLPPVSGTDDRDDLVRSINYPGDRLWSEPGRRVHDPHTLAWIETGDPRALRGYASRAVVGPDESVKVTRDDPQRVEFEAVLDRPGFVILADTIYPGWRLTIDGRPAPILRANRIMRGAAVTGGQHALVYRYFPLSLRAGLALTPLGFAVLIGLVVVEARKRRPGP